MSISKEELRKVLPKNGPNIDEVSKYIEKYKEEIITIKYRVIYINFFMIQNFKTYTTDD